MNIKSSIAVEPAPGTRVLSIYEGTLDPVPQTIARVERHGTAEVIVFTDGGCEPMSLWDGGGFWILPPRETA